MKKSAVSIVRGIRADEDFWKKWQKVAESKGMSTNYLVVKVMNNYCNKVLTSKKSCDKIKTGHFS